MGDPLFLDGVDWVDVVLIVVKAGIAFFAALIATALMIWFERKLISDMQNRIGPNVAGPFGILQTLADGAKFFFKEDLRPARADPFVYRLAPYLTALTAFLSFAIVPVAGDFADKGGVINFFGRDTYAQVADPPAGVLFLLAMSSIAVYGVMMAGWSSGSKYPLLGSVRASAQAISYEAAMGLAVVAVVLVAGSLRTHDIVLAQVGDWWILEGGRNWNIVATGIVPFVLFVIAATAELNRPPFDLVEAEQELVGGFHTEYSSIRFALFFLAEFMNVVTMSAIFVTLFLGGPTPLFGPSNAWLSLLWFVAKVLLFCFMFVWFRATLPRLRYDQLMSLGWKVMIPLALGWVLLLSAIRLWRDERLDLAWLLLVGVPVGLVSMVLLLASFDAGNRAHDRELEEAGRLR